MVGRVRGQSAPDEGTWPTSQANPHNTGWTAGQSGVATTVEAAWSFDPQLEPAGVSITADQAFVTTYNGESDPYAGTVHALDAATGTQQWQFDANLWTYNTTVVGSTVFVQANGGGDGRVYALDADDGSPMWIQREDSEIVSSPTVVDGVAFTGIIDDEVVALDAANGAVQWRSGVGGAVWSGPAVVDGTVYVTCDYNPGGDPSASGVSTVHALDSATGTEQWRYEVGPTRVMSPPVLADGTVLVDSYDGVVHALSATDGTVQWTFATGADPLLELVAHDGTVFVGGNSSLTALDSTDSKRQWAADFESPIEGLIGTTDALYLSTEDGGMSGVDIEAGTVTDVSVTDGSAPSPTAFANEMIYSITDRRVGAYEITERTTASTDQAVGTQSVERQSGEQAEEDDDVDGTGVPFFQRFRDTEALPLALLGGVAGGLGLGAYRRYSNGDEE